MTAQNQQRPALLDLRATAEFLGVPLHSIRRWHHRGNAPTGFPAPVRFGPRIAYLTAEIEHWAKGFTAPKVVPARPDLGTLTPPEPAPAKRPRGRPRKQPAVPPGGAA